MVQSPKLGNGLINNIIDRIPFELHVPTYKFCGPGQYQISSSRRVSDRA